MTDKSVYVSYSWTAERETPLVDELDHVCTTHGLDFRRDNNRLQHGDLIRSFMDELSSHGDIIIVFSSAYFKSKYCIYELWKIWKNGNFQKRIHPILIENIRIDDMHFQLEIIKFWNNEAVVLQKQLSEFDIGVTIEQRKQLLIYYEIYSDIGKLLSFISNMVILPLSVLRAKGFRQIFEKFEYNHDSTTNKAEDNRHLKQSKKLELEIENLAVKNKEISKELIDVYSEITKLESDSDSDYRKIFEWLSKNKDSHIKKTHELMVKEYGDLVTTNHTVANELELKAFRINLSHLIEDLETCLLNNRTDSIDEPYIREIFDGEVYKKALSFLSKRIPSWASEESKNKLNYYIDYLIDRI